MTRRARTINERVRAIPAGHAMACAVRTQALIEQLEKLLKEYKDRLRTGRKA